MSGDKLKNSKIVLVLKPFLGIAAAVFINIFFNRLMGLLHIPLFMDNIGTLLAAGLGGYLPGIITGYMTNVVNMTADIENVYYASLSVLIAVAGSFFYKRGYFDKFGKALLTVPAFADETVVILSGDAASQGLVTVQSGSTASQMPMVFPDASAASSTVILDAASEAPASQVIVVNPAEDVRVTREVAVPQNTQAEVVTVSPGNLRSTVFALANVARRNNNVPELSYSDALQDAADVRAKESATYFHHSRPDGTPAESAVTTDWNVTAENLIQVTSEYATAEIMMETWMNSETHRDNLLNAAFHQVAVGVYESEGTTYVSLVFTD